MCTCAVLVHVYMLWYNVYFTCVFVFLWMSLVWECVSFGEGSVLGGEVLR